jgi:hypothetical protein
VVAIDLAGDQAGEDLVVVVLEAVDALVAVDALAEEEEALRRLQTSRRRSKALRFRGQSLRISRIRCSR